MPSSNESWLQRVRYTAAEPTSWLNHALTLRQAAEDLWIAGNRHEREPGTELGTTVLVEWKAEGFEPAQTGGSTRDVCFMLFGFALENLAKGILLCRKPSLVTKARLILWHGKGHDISALFSAAAITVSEVEIETLDRTSRQAGWRGRYPVPMKFHTVRAQDRVAGHTIVTHIWPLDEYDRLCSIYERVKKILLAELEATAPLSPDHRF